MIPDRGMEDAHIAGHGPRYPSSAKGGFRTMTCRGQLHCEWVLRSASEGAINMALKPSTRVHSLHLPWVWLTHGVMHQGKCKLSPGGKILHSKRGTCSFGLWKQRPTWFLGLLTPCQKKQNPWAAQHSWKCASNAVLCGGFVISPSPEPIAVTPLELGRPHPVLNSFPLRRASSPPHAPDVAVLWETRA